MTIHHLRNATFVIETKAAVILVDPMLGPRGFGAPFTMFRFKPKRNPLVNLPESAPSILDKVTHCLITHLHPDHIDPTAIEFLKTRNIPVVCSFTDAKVLKKKGLTIDKVLNYWEPADYLGGRIIGVPAIHGYGFVKHIAGKVMGFHLELPGEPSIYISSDTVYTDHVDRALKEFKPEISVLAAGKAQLDIGQPLLMHEADQVKFVQNSPGRVFANHMEALNHCPHTRADLRRLLQQNGLLAKVDIPEDGESVAY